MVRLKHEQILSQVKNLKFQFLYGPIKTQGGGLGIDAGWLFQFLYGPIKTDKRCISRDHLRGFQFLYGPIKTYPARRDVRFLSISIPLWSD